MRWDNDVLGLPAEESAAYRALITVPSAGPEEFAELLVIEAGQAAKLLAGLEAAGLAVRSLGDPGRFVATPPSSALRAVLLRRRHELQQAEAELGALDEVYRAATVRRGAGGVVDIVDGAAAVRELFGRLQLGAREEVLSFVKAPVAVISGSENVAEDTAVERGVRYRVLLERAMLDEEPGFFDRLEHARAAGEEVRIAETLPLKLIVVDRELALVPLHANGTGPAAALLVHESGLLHALIALFEAEWLRASPVVVAAEPAGLEEMDSRILSLLMTGLTDEAVAAHLGTSLRTVQRRVRHLMDLTGGRTRLQLGFQVAKRGWLG
jgi:sugar-specific transcriptional regulator TrmB/DNA-binding CsgD family transcriptional regulator